MDPPIYHTYDVFMYPTLYSMGCLSIPLFSMFSPFYHHTYHNVPFLSYSAVYQPCKVQILLTSYVLGPNHQQRHQERLLDKAVIQPPIN